MFELDRTFCERNNKNGLMEWYFQTREGLVGPYASKEIAVEELEIFKQRRSQSGDDGGRDTTTKKLTLVPFAADTVSTQLDHNKRRKGLNEE